MFDGRPFTEDVIGKTLGGRRKRNAKETVYKPHYIPYRSYEQMHLLWMLLRTVVLKKSQGLIKGNVKKVYTISNMRCIIRNKMLVYTA